MIENRFLKTEFQSKSLCNSWVATAIVGAGVVSAGATAYSANKAAGAQKDASAQAIATQKGMYDTTRGDLSPYREAGANATTELQNRLPFLTSPIDVTAELNNPDSVVAKAYDFTKTQGLKAVQNSATARGLGVSGAALKGAANFTTGLANNTWQNLFQTENTNRANAFNRLKSLVDTGENAAAQTGTVGANTANQISGAQVGAGNAVAAADNSIGSAVSRATTPIAGYAAYKGLYGGNPPSSNVVSSGWDGVNQNDLDYGRATFTG